MANAWSVEIYEKKEVKEAKNGPMAYEDPWKSYAFPTSSAAMKFLQERLDKLKPGNSDGEYSDGFKEAISKAKPKK
jgi:hypothetical protein